MRPELKSHTHHSFLPDDAHAVLNPGVSVGDLGEIILAHGSLFDGEGPVVRRHNIQGVAAAEQSRAERVTPSAAAEVERECTGSSSSPSQQAHQVVGGTGVQAEGRHGDVGGGVGPVLVVVLHAVQHRVGCGGFTVDHLTWEETGQRCLRLVGRGEGDAQACR